MVIPFPAYRPTSWELQLPNYRVITNNWRATEAPEILGSLPEDARLRLRYENITDQQALELLLLWRATAGGYYPLDPLPAEVAAGINDAALANRIRSIAPLSWVVADPPRQESIKNLRSGLDIELKSELRFVPSIAIPTVTCPVYAARQYAGCAGAPPALPGPAEVLPGITVDGFYDPNGSNRICVTAVSCAWYNIFYPPGGAPGFTVPPLLGIDATPGPRAAPLNCTTIAQGPFNITVWGISGGTYPTRLNVDLFTQAGALLSSRLATVSGAPNIGLQGYDAPATIAFTITPINQAIPFAHLARELIYSELPTGQDPNLTPGQQTYQWPAIRSINVSPP